MYLKASSSNHCVIRVMKTSYCNRCNVPVETVLPRDQRQLRGSNRTITIQRQSWSVPHRSTKPTNSTTRNQEHPLSHLASVRLVRASPVPMTDTEEEAGGRGRTEGGCSKNTRLAPWDGHPGHRGCWSSTTRRGWVSQHSRWKSLDHSFLHLLC